jgi:glycosyltransferase involved in cell wall biosynthesis
MKRTLVQNYGFPKGKIRVIHNGIPLPEEIGSSSSSANDSFHIGSVGRLFPVKNFSLFLKVAAKLQKRNRKVRFSILGDGPLKEELIREARDFKILDTVEFLQPRPDPSAYYRSLDVYLNTSVSEGIPLSILEAMALGKPVVASRVGGIPEIISSEENGFLVDALEEEKFVEPILRLIENKELRKQIGNRAKARIASFFNIHVTAVSYQNLYQS